MSFDGSGVYSLTYTWATEAASPPIAISKLDTEMAGIAAGLSLAILRNGAGKPTADIDWNTKKITNLANATADADALNRVTADGRYVRAGGDETITGTWSFDVTPTVDGDALWHAGNDGAGSGLDADTVDGVQASALAQMSSGSFTVSLRETSPTGTVIDTGTAYWKKAGDVVTLRLPPALWATSTATNFYLTGLPAEIRVGAIGGAAGPTLPVVVTDNGTVKIGYVVIDPQTDRMSLSLPPSGFTGSSGNKGIDYAATLTYAVAD